MQEPNEGGENQSPQDRSEVTTGAARLGAALPNTSTDQPTHISEGAWSARLYSSQYLRTQLTGATACIARTRNSDSPLTQ